MATHVPGTANADDVPRLAECARAFERKLQGIEHDLDPEWREALRPTWPFLEGLPAGVPRQQLVSRLLVTQMGGLPALERLLDPAARLVLLERPALLSRLCMLALARRPGMLRCCIERPVRQALMGALDEDFDVLMRLTLAGAPFRHEATGWVPMQWACAGYFDWAALLVSGDGVLRRIARLSLPRRLLRRVQELRPVPAQLSSRRALAALAEAGVAWPC